MASLGPTHLISLVIAVAIITATCWLITSAVVRSTKRRRRSIFFLGFFCGWMTGAIVRRRRRGLNALRAAARWTAAPQRRAGKLGTSSRFAVHTLTLAASPIRGGLRSCRWHRGARRVNT